MRKVLHWQCVAVLLVVAGIAGFAGAFAFNGTDDFQTDVHGYYYAITGGKIPAGTTRNGDNASGGTFRYIHDSDYWGQWYAKNTWVKDDWFPQNAGLALTMLSNGVTVYDNNGIEDGTYGNYYDATAQGLPSAQTPGLYRGYCMSNNFDWIYATYFKLEEDVLVDTIIGYFDANAGLDPFDPELRYRMNIWSEEPGTLMPVNTGSFDGDVFTSDGRNVSFLVSDSNVDRIFGTDYNSMHDDIWRLTMVLDQPLLLRAGEYYFSHDAVIQPIPEPVSAALAALALGGLDLAATRRR